MQVDAGDTPMTTLLITHPKCLAHDPGAFHPECPDRLRAVLRGLEKERFSLLERARAPQATQEQLCRVHPPAYVAGILAIRPPDGELAFIDGDTVMSHDSAEAALYAAGAAVAGVDAVMAGEASNVFAAVRPPGHHAEPGRACGFCLFNNVAVAALHARAAHGLRRVAVVDFDVHHGNGTQAMFWDDADLFYASTHQAPLFPGTGLATDRGVADNIVNVPLRGGSGSAEFRAAWDGTILPALEAFGPEMLMISAGFDAHRADPLAQLRLDTEDFDWISRRLLNVAETHCKGRIVSVLEGGYDLAALAASAAAHVRVLMGN
jgi:acetoin utilization deacetylase AcuC-like enzyme